LKKVLIFIVFWLFVLSAHSQSRDSFTVYVFLLDECRICQEISPELRKIADITRDQNIGMTGFFPNHATTEEGLKKFIKKYKINFQVKTDHDKKMAEKFSAAVLPEVVVWNETRQQVFYRGAVNNLFFAPGKRRHHISQNYLKDAIFAIQKGIKPEISVTEPVGCLINYSENEL
jgi:peroxiredoxin